ADPDVARSGADAGLAGDPARLDVAGGGFEPSAPDAAEREVGARPLRADLALDLLDLDVARRRLDLGRAQQAAGADLGRRRAHVQPRVLRTANREADLLTAAEDSEPPHLRHLDDHLGRAVATRPELDARLLDEPLGRLAVE